MSKDKEILKGIRFYLGIIDENIKRCQEQQDKTSDPLRDLYLSGEKIAYEETRHFLNRLLEEFDSDNC